MKYFLSIDLNFEVYPVFWDYREKTYLFYAI